MMATCDRCGANLVERRGPAGPFLGCSRFPACRGSRSLDPAAAAARPAYRPTRDEPEPLPTEPPRWIAEPGLDRAGRDVVVTDEPEFEGPDDWFDEDVAIERAERRYDREIAGWGRA